MFETSHDILKAMERHVIGSPYGERDLVSKGLDYVKSVFVYPIRLLKVGFNNGVCKEAIKFSFISFTIMVALGIFLKDLSPETGESFPRYLIFAITFALPLVLTLFPLPSSIASQGIKDAHVRHGARLIAERGFRSEKGMELLRSNMKVFEQSVIRRINILRAGMALLWTFFIYLYSQTAVNEAMPTSQAVVSSFESLVGMFLVVLAYFILLDSYRKATNIIFRGLELGATEYKFELLATGESTNLGVRTKN